MSPSLKFIRINISSIPKKDLNLLDKAASFAEANKVDVSILKETEALNKIVSSNVVDESLIFVLFPFEGNIFELLKSKGYRVVGPQCILSCLLLEIPVPKQPHPVCNVAMAGVVACCSSMKKEERLTLQNLILSMGGEFSGSFTTDVSHLIAKEVGSKKYQVACQHNIPVLLPKWVHDTWEKSKYDHVLINDMPNYSEYLVPIFKGCTICVTGLDVDTRENIKKLVIENGGNYSGELNMKTCTHLLCEYPKGQKYAFAKQWKLHCIYPKWFYDCIISGHWLDESSYQLEGSENGVLSMSESQLQRTKLGETLMNKSNFNSTSKKAALVAAKSRETSLFQIEQSESLSASKSKFFFFDSSKLDLEKIVFPVVSNNCYLDGFKIYVNNKPSKLFDCCRKIINEGGAIRFSHLSESTTHLIAWDVVDSAIKSFMIDFKGTKPFLVSPKWLIDSCCSQEVKSEADYLLYVNNEEVQTDVELNRKKSIIPTAPRATSINIDFEDDHGDDTTLMNQYMSGNHESTRLSQVNPGLAPKQSNTQQTTLLENGDETETFNSPPVQVFCGKTFSVCRFDEESTKDLEEEVEQYGGTVVTAEEKCDHILVPLSYTENIKPNKNEVTICWFEQCWERGELLSIYSSYLFLPIHIPLDVKPLEGCFISISQYSGVERTHLFHLVALLGGTGQEVFARFKGNGVNASTHLILINPEGPKYEAAMKWGIPTVSKKWLIECCKKQKLLPEADYPVEEGYEESFVDIPETTANGRNNPGVECKENVTEPVAMETISMWDNQSKEKTANDSVFDETSERDTSRKEVSDNVKSCKERQSNLPTEDQFRSPLANSLLPIKPALEFDKSRYSFDFTGALDGINSPAAFSQDSARRKSRKSRLSLPFDVQFIEAVQKAVDKHVPEEDRANTQPSILPSVARSDVSHQLSKPVERTIGILHDTCIVISKKLSQRQTELHSLVNALGGITKFLYSDECTHFVHQGRINDTAKDYLQAKSNNKHLVSPFWLEACMEANEKVSESKYPVNFNPRMSIDVLSESRSTRSKLRTGDKEKNEQNESKEKAVVVATRSKSKRDRSAIEENNDALGYQKKMEEIMKATTGSSRTTRKSSRKLTNTPKAAADMSNMRNLQSSSGSPDSNTSTRTSGASTRGMQKIKYDLPQTMQEHSQNDCITYDDPTGRIEREKILAQLKQASPSQDVEFMQNNILRKKDQLKQIGNPIVEECEKNENSSSKSFKIPEQIVSNEMLIAKRVDESNTISLLSDDEDEKENEKVGEKVYRFIMSGMSAQEKIDYAALIESLGGVFYDVQYFKTDCSHLIVNAPSRNEKYLSTISSGKWALHKSFLEASRENGAFVNEEDHEWGNHDNQNDLATAAKKWRLELTKRRKKDSSAGAFTGWVVLLCIADSKQPGFKRILEAGGAKVNHIRPPFTKTADVTHVVVEDMQLAQQTNVDFKQLQELGAWVVRPEYISDYLSITPTPPTINYIIEELRHDAKQTNVSFGKRKAASAITSNKLKRNRYK